MSSHPSLSKSKKAMPLPLASMMERLWSTPPQTLGIVSPACWATSTYWTGDGELETAASTSAEFFHFHSGVVSVSSNVLLRTKRDEPRKRRRGKFIDADSDYKEHGQED